MSQVDDIKARVMARMGVAPAASEPDPLRRAVRRKLYGLADYDAEEPADALYGAAHMAQQGIGAGDVRVSGPQAFPVEQGRPPVFQPFGRPGQGPVAPGPQTEPQPNIQLDLSRMGESVDGGPMGAPHAPQPPRDPGGQAPQPAGPPGQFNPAAATGIVPPGDFPPETAAMLREGGALAQSPTVQEFRDDPLVAHREASKGIFRGVLRAPGQIVDAAASTTDFGRRLTNTITMGLTEGSIGDRALIQLRDALTGLGSVKKLEAEATIEGMGAQPKETESFPIQAASTIGEAAPMVGVQVGAAMATRGASLPVQLGAFAGTAAAPVVGQAYREALEETGDPELASTEAAADGLITLTTSVLPGMAILRRTPAGAAIDAALRRRAGAAIAAGGAEAMQEYVEGSAQDVTAELIRRDKSLAEIDWPAVLVSRERALELVAGGVLGGAAQVAVSAAQGQTQGAQETPETDPAWDEVRSRLGALDPKQVREIGARSRVHNRGPIGEVVERIVEKGESPEAVIEVVEGVTQETTTPPQTSTTPDAPPQQGSVEIGQVDSEPSEAPQGPPETPAAPSPESPPQAAPVQQPTLDPPPALPQPPPSPGDATSGEGAAAQQSPVQPWEQTQEEFTKASGWRSAMPDIERELKWRDFSEDNDLIASLKKAGAKVIEETELGPDILVDEEGGQSLRQVVGSGGPPVRIAYETPGGEKRFGYAFRVRPDVDSAAEGYFVSDREMGAEEAYNEFLRRRATFQKKMEERRSEQAEHPSISWSRALSVAIRDGQPVPARVMEPLLRTAAWRDVFGDFEERARRGRPVTPEQLAMLERSAARDHIEPGRQEEEKRIVQFIREQSPTAPEAPTTEPEAPSRPEPIDDTPEARRAAFLEEVESYGQRLEERGRERIRKAQLPTKPGERGAGGTILPEALLGVAEIAAGRLIRVGATTGKVATQALNEIRAEFGDVVGDQWAKVRREAVKQARAELPKARKQAQESVKARVRRTTGQTDTSRPIQTTEAKALKDKLKTEERTARRVERQTRREVKQEERAKGKAQLEALREKMRGQALKARLRGEQRVGKLAFREGEKQSKDAGRAFRDEAVRLIESAVPAAERGKLLTQVRDADTIGGLRRTVSRALKVIREADHRDARRDLTAAIKRAKKAKLRPEYAEVVEALIADLDLTQMSPKLRRALRGTAAYLKQNPDAQVPEHVTERLARLDRQSVAEMPAEEIRQVTDAIDQAVHHSKFKNQLLGRRRGRTRDRAAADAIEEMEKRVPKLGEAGPMLRLIRRAGGGYTEWSARSEVLLEHLSPSLRELVWEDITVHAHSQELELLWKIRDAMSEAAEKAGRPIGPGFERWRARTFEVATPDGPIQMSVGTALWINVTMRDPSNARLAERQGFALDGQLVPVTEELLAQVDREIGPEGIAFAEHMHEQFNGVMKDALNAAWLEAYGVHIAREPSYAPRNIDMAFADTKQDPMEAMAREREGTVKSWGHLRERIGAAAPIEIGDAFDTYLSHARHVARISAYLVPVNNAHAVLGRRDVKQAIIKRLGHSGYSRILEDIKAQTVPAAQDDTSRFFRRFMRLYGTSKLGLRISTVLYTPASLPVSLAYIEGGGFRDLLPALAKGGPEAIRVMEQRIAPKMREHSPYWRTRYEDFSHQVTAGVTAPLGARGGRTAVAPRRLRNIPSYLRHVQLIQATGTVADAGMIPLQKADQMFGVLRGVAAERVVRRRGIKEGDEDYWPEVAREWERSIFRGESTSHGGDMSGLLAWARENVGVAFFTQFLSSVMKVNSVLTRGGLAATRAQRLARAGDVAGVKREGAIAIRSLSGGAASIVWVGAVIQAVLDIVRDEDRDLLERMGLRVGTEIISLVPIFGGEVGVPVLRRALNEPSYQFPANFLENFLSDLRGAVDGVIDIAEQMDPDRIGTDWGEIEKAFVDLAEFLGDVTGVPVSGPVDAFKIGEKLLGVDE